MKEPAKETPHDLDEARIAAAAPESTEPAAADAVKAIAEKKLEVLEDAEESP